MISVEDWQKMTRDIVAASGDQAALTALVTQANDAMSEAMNDFASADNERNQLREENESLRKANMNFFLRLTEQNETSKQPEAKPEEITIADLFKEDR